MKSLKLVLLTLTILIPSLTFAANLEEFSGNVVVNDEKSLFRFRSIPGIFQRVPIESEQYDDITVVKDSAFVAAKNGSQYALHQTNNGLSYINIFTSNQPIMFNDDDFALSGESVIDLTTTLQLAMPPTANQTNLFRLGGLPMVAVINSSTVEIFKLGESSQLLWSASCTGGQLFLKPKPILRCTNGVYELDETGLTHLSDATEIISASNQLLLFLEPLTDIYYLYDGEDLMPLQFSDLSPTDELIVIGNRLFRKNLDAVYEINWAADPVVVSQLPELSVPRLSRDSYIILEGNQTYLSDRYGDWLLTNLNQGFEVINTVNGRLAYTPDDDLAYFDQGSGNFQEMTSSWSASSKIRSVEEFGSKLMLILRNSSNNPNLYTSVDYASWQRISLPSQPTYITDVKTARTLPPGTLVEIAANLSVLPDVVGAGIGYIEDSLAGIQVYLSPTRGQLDESDYRRTIALGEISSSQVGRIILADRSHLITGLKYSPNLNKATIKQAKTNPGKTYTFRVKLVNLLADYATVQDSSDSIRLHADGIKDKFFVDDTVEVRAVVDLNSSSGDIEAWAIDTKLTLISRPVSDDLPTPPTTVKVSNTSGVTKVPTHNGPSLGATSIAIDVPNVTKDIKVASASEQPETPGWLMLLSGLLAGVVAVKGSRFSKVKI